MNGTKKLLSFVLAFGFTLALASCGGGGETVKVTSVSISNEKVTIEEEKTKQLTATVYPSNATDKTVTWSSSNTNYVTVDSTGLLKGIAPGNAIVTVTTNDGGFKKACAVTVEEKLPDVIGSVSLVFAEPFGQTIKDNLNTQLDEFINLVRRNDLIDVDIKYQDSSDYKSLENQIISNLSTGDVPNIAVAYPDHVADYLALEPNDGDYVVNILDLANDEEIGFGREEWLGDDPNDLVNDNVLDDFIASYIEEGQQFVKDGLYTFPYMKSTEAMFYNVNATAKALGYLHPDITTPAQIKNYMDTLTWDEFMDLCRVVKQHKNEISDKLVTPAFYDSDSNLFISQMFQLGIPFSSVNSSTGSGRIEFADGQAKKDALDLITSLKANYDEGLFTTKGAYSTYGSDSFKNIESVFSIGSTGGTGYNMTTDFDIGICKVPYKGQKGVYVSQGPSLSIMKNPKKTKQVNDMEVTYSWKLLKFLTQANRNTILCTKGTEGYLPVRESAYVTDEYIDFIEQGGYIAQTCEVVRNDINGNFLSTACFKGSSELRTQVGGMVSAVFLGTSSIQDAFQAAIDNTLNKM